MQLLIEPWFALVLIAVGAALPRSVAAVSPASSRIILVAVTSLLVLAMLGAVAARAGGASALRGAWRVFFWGAMAMIITALIGRAFNTTV